MACVRKSYLFGRDVATYRINGPMDMMIFGERSHFDAPLASRSPVLVMTFGRFEVSPRRLPSNELNDIARAKRSSRSL